MLFAGDWRIREDWLGYSPAPIYPTVPLMSSQLDPTDISRWLTFGYDASDVLQFLQATHAIISHAHAQLDLRFPNQVAVKTILDDAARSAEASASDSIQALSGKCLLADSSAQHVHCSMCASR
jgi:hypothetical protein